MDAYDAARYAPPLIRRCPSFYRAHYPGAVAPDPGAAGTKMEAETVPYALRARPTREGARP